MQVSRITSDQELFSLQSEWNSIVGGCPHHSWEWLHSWWETFADQRELFVLVCRDIDGSGESQGNIVGILPLYLERNLTNGTVLSFLGSGKACTEYLSVFTKSGSEAAATSAFAEWLMENQNEWDQIDLENTRSSDDRVRTFLEKLDELGAEISAVDGDRCWRLSLPSTHDEFVASLAKRYRRKVRDAYRKVIETESFSMSTAEDADSLEKMFDEFVDLHIRRRMTVDGDHCFQSDKFCEFLQLAANRLLGTGMLDLSTVAIDGTTASVVFGLKDEHSFYLYQSGMNPDLQHHSPGWVINCVKIATAIEKGQKHYEFLRGDEPYKRHMGAEPIATTHYRIAAPKTASRIRHQIWKAKQSMRTWGKGLIPPSSA